ncbi:MAG TPA: pectinesterase family protein [Thermoanaerobaculia bacterium]|nr:pectinesterase family protein [Thermoanaerobaculia bacterium]
MRIPAAWLQIGLTALLVCPISAQVKTYENPVLFGDYSDPDAIRVGNDYYLVASSFQCVPGLPILHSLDLVNWTIVSHAVSRLPSPDFDRAQHGNGLWAPSLRYHDGEFWIYAGDPDRGIFMTRAKDARGPWEPLTLVKAAKGWIDPCPLWDDDGSMYLVHAWAKSRAGFNSVLTVNRMSADGTRVIDDGRVVFDGRERQPTIEGPKFYKRNGWYYIFAPAGGVRRGWQTVLRSKNVYGPYEDRVVLEQGTTTVNGPHQGAWVESADGSSWFLHFQDRGAYGRVVHLQPMTWVNEWPDIHIHPPSTGETRVAPHDWQWHGNPQPGWISKHDDLMTLTAVATPGPNLWSATNLLLQKFSAPAFTATTRIDPSGLRTGDRAGVLIMGEDYSALTVDRTDRGLVVRRVVARDADQGSAESESAAVPIDRGPIELRVSVAPEAICRFSYSVDGQQFKTIGTAFAARPGRWIGAKVGLFASGSGGGHAAFDGFHIEPATVTESASLVVAQDGSGDFRTIQEAIDAIPRDNEQNRTILIRNGTYREKLFIAKSNLSLVGEDRDKTRIEYAQLRREWRASHPDDWGAAVINIGNDVTDVIIANLTVRNDYGATHDDHDHQFAIRSMDRANRIAILNANVIADGGDTLSLWNAESGLSYYADSYFEGWVDFVCPRGWAYATNSRFFGHNLNASIWHDGSRSEDQKFVIRHSQFDGVPGFALGRNHRDAQFYLLDAHFSSDMADKPIYPVPDPGLRQWGERYYYFDAHRDGGDFAWFADNLRAAQGAPRDEDITATWTFGGRWDPRTLPSVLPFASIPEPENGWRWVGPAGVKVRWTPGRNARAQRVYFDVGPALNRPGPTESGPYVSSYDTGPLEAGKTYFWRVDTVTPDGVVAGPLWSFRVDPRDVRIALAGDSTMTEKSGYDSGFKARIEESAALLNLSRGGRSSKSYAAEGHWQVLLHRKPTHVLIQFGHNDAEGKGLDRETDLPSFRANLGRYVDEARAAGIKPILVTPLTRRYFNAEGRIRSDLVERAEVTRQVAAEKNVPLIDLHARSIELLEHLGPSISSAISPLKTDGTFDKTHLNREGSAMFGALVAEELGRVVPELAPHIRAGTLPIPVPAWSARTAESVMKRTPDPLMLDTTDRPAWNYTQGLVLGAILEVAQRCGDERYWKYVLAYYDPMIGGDGTIRGYRRDEYSLDRINAGKVLFPLYAKTHEEKYRKAIEALRQQLREQPRTSEGGFWHKKRYPHQMWLDGLYMAAPFLAQYAKEFNEPATFDDVINQFVLMEKHARDPKNGLLYHGWDESREQKWADPKTGTSPSFWGRAMGWYAMALVDTLDFLPLDHPRRPELIAILQRLAEAITRVQDPKSGVWWQVLDQGGRKGNYLEASVSTMFSSALMKAARLGYLDGKYGDAGRRAYAGIVKTFIEVDKEGLVDIHHVCQVAGLGGDPEKERYRDGTYEYYVNEKVRSNDPKAVGPFIFASLERER